MVEVMVTMQLAPPGRDEPQVLVWVNAAVVGRNAMDEIVMGEDPVLVKSTTL